MIERTLVFVDTSYLLASFYNSWEEGARGQLEISLANVVVTLNHHARLQVNQPVQRQFWYDGIPDSGPHRYQRTLRVIEGVQLRAGQLIEWGDRRTQKAVDTLLVADMVTAALRAQCSDMVLVSGDADMIPGVRAAVEAGVRVHLVGFGWDSIASSLRHQCDTCTVLDPRGDFADCMQIRVLEGPVTPTVRRPAPRPAAPGDEGHAADAREPVDPLDGGRSPGRARATSVADEEAAHRAAEEEAAAEPTMASDPGPAPEVPVEADDAVASDAAGGADGAGGAAASVTRSATITDSVTVTATGAAEDAEELDDPDAIDDPADPDGPTDRTDPADPDGPADPGPGPARPNPSMMAARRKPVRSRYVPLADEVWTSSGETTPFDVGQQYATWWYDQAASEDERDGAHLLSGGPLPPTVDRPLLQFACQVLNEFTLTEYQRVSLRDGFHEGIRTVLLRAR